MENTKKTLVFGVGNELLTDDGIGPQLVKQLKDDISSDNIYFETAFVGGLEILDFIQGYETAIFIDAIKTKDGIAGDIYEFELSDFKETLHLSNLHDISFLTAIELGKRIDYKIPERIKIIAIEIVEDMVYSDNFSPQIKQKYEDIYKEVLEHIKQYIL